MTEDGAGLSVLAVLANAGSKDLSTDQGANAADHVNRGRTGEIMEAHFSEETAAPDPVTGDRVDEQRDRCGVDAVSREFSPLSHGTGNDGGGGGTEDGLEDGVCPERNARRKNMAVILHDKGIDPAEECGAGAEHNAVAEQPVQRGTDTEVHQVLHQNVTGIFGAGETRFTHGESRLHEEDQSCS